MGVVLPNTCDIFEAHGENEAKAKLSDGWYVMDTRTEFLYNEDKVMTSFVILMGKTPAGRQV